MSVTILDTCDIRVEKAFGAYLRGYRDRDADDPLCDRAIETVCNRAGELLDVAVIEGRSTVQRTLPALVVTVRSCERMYPGVDWFKMALEIDLFTHRREDGKGIERPDVIHNARALAVQELLRDEDAVKRAINKPSGALDTRDVTNITIMGCVLENMSADVQANALMQRWELDVHAAPWDSVHP